MIERVNKIQNYQIFKDFSWPDDLPNFKKYNLIYGWNGSGKSTLANLFRQIEKKEVAPECGNFEIVTTDFVINRDNLSSLSLKIKVFNEDFIKENIFTPSGEVNPIFFLGQQDISNKKKIESLKKEKGNLLEESVRIKKEQDSNKKDIEKLFKFTAKNIKEILRSNGPNPYNNYESPDVKSKLNILKKENSQTKILTDSDIFLLTTKIKATSKEPIEQLFLRDPQISQIIPQIEALLDETIVSQVIDRLKKDNRLNQWVNEGLSIYTQNNQENCPFCEQKISEDYVKKLELHFNDKYLSFIKRLDNTITKILDIVETLKIQLPDSARFYDDLSKKYLEEKKALESEIHDESIYLNGLCELLEEKKMNPFIKITIKNKKPIPIISLLVTNVNNVIQEHNQRTENFSKDIEFARNTLEEHFVSEVMEEFVGLEYRQIQIDKNIEKNSKDISEIQSEIIQLENGFLSHALAAQKINNDLRDFLNREEIKLSVKENGYEITRNGIITNRLSEGEKTAISFIYFLNSLNERDFDVSEGIIVIDDPVSSFDSNSLFNAAAFLKENTKDANQLIILTHNFSFFKEIKDWMNHDGNANQSSKYMLKNYLVDNCRIAHLAKLDKLLSSYNSEYHFLFSVVYEYANSSENELKNCYPLPNISRRLLESFLAFRVPSGISMKKKMDLIQGFDETKKKRIYRFTNENSHNNIITTDTHGDLSYLIETKDVLSDILALIKFEDPKHFNAMLSVIE